MIVPAPRRRFDPAVPEMMDRPGNDPAMLRDDLRNLRIINKFFGGLRAIETSILPILRNIDSGSSVEILDLATGSADQPIHVMKLARKLKREIRITAIDKNPLMISEAAERVRSYPEISLMERDILDLPFAEKSFDIVLCSLALHHFSRSDAVKILKEMNRLSRHAFVVNDLNRTRRGAFTTWLYTHLTSLNPITLNDSYLSVLRAFTRDELESMAFEAGLKNFTIKTRPFFRLILVGKNR